MVHEKSKCVRLKVGPSSISVQFFEEALPHPSSNEVIVRIHASSLNYHDYLVMTGAIPVADGRIPLSDGAGTVVAVGSGVEGLAPGDRVIGTFFPNWFGGQPTPDAVADIAGDTVDGFAADYVVMSARSFTPLPAGLSFSEAAIIPCAGVTAWTALTRDGGVAAGAVVVVQGTGGVAIWALQLAKSMGARVIALTSSREKCATLQSLGADLIIDYTAEPDWPSAVMEFTDGTGADLIVEVVGGANIAQSIAACRMGGRIAAIGFLADAIAPVFIPGLLLRHIKISGRAVGSHADQKSLIDYIDNNSIHPFVGNVFTLNEIEKAFDELKQKKVCGKIVLTH